MIDPEVSEIIGRIVQLVTALTALVAAWAGVSSRLVSLGNRKKLEESHAVIAEVKQEVVAVKADVAVVAVKADGLTDKLAAVSREAGVLEGHAAGVSDEKAEAKSETQRIQLPIANPPSGA